MEKVIWYSEEYGSDNMPKPDTGSEFWNINGIYLHGDLENEIGYDICYNQIKTSDYDILSEQYQSKEITYEEYQIRMQKLLGVKIGKYPVTILANGKSYEALAFVWGIRRGLVCLVDDEESIAYAKKRFREKAEYI